MSPTKRVAHVLWRSRGGIRRHVRYLAEHPPCGWSTQTVYGPAELEGFFAGLPFRPVTQAGILRCGRDADLIHAHGLTAGLAGLLPGRPPVVLSVHTLIGRSGRTARSSAVRILGSLVTARADEIIAVSERGAVGLPRARVIAPAYEPLPAPVRDRIDMRAELGAGDDVVVVAVARLDPDKGLELFIQAVDAAGCVGWIVGDGSDRGRLDALAGNTRTRMLGYRSDIAEILAAADVFALPSFSESHPIAVAEALSSGLPVIATDVGATVDLVGDAGIVVAAGDREAFLNAVSKLAGDTEERKRLADLAGRALLPDPRSLVAAVGEVYDRAVRAAG